MQQAPTQAHSHRRGVEKEDGAWWGSGLVLGGGSTRVSKNQRERVAGWPPAKKGGGGNLSLWLFLLACPWTPSSQASLALLFALHVVGIFGYKTGLEATESLIVPS